VSRRNAIPSELRQLNQWVGWRWEEREGKRTKPPYTADGSRKAKCNDPTTWAPFEVVCAGVDAGKLDGVGFQVKESDPYVGVDLDHCRDTESGAITPSAKAIVDRYASYSEVSPSGTGIRIFIKAVKPGPRCREGNVEIYNRDRFFTVTGRHLADTPLTIEERQTELEAHYAELFPAKPSVNGHASRGPGDLTAYEIIEHARQASNAAHWEQLMRGDLSEYGGDQSRADAALCALAAFYTRDPSTIDQIVRLSGLCRPKWTDRADYRERTIDGALELVTETYQASGGVLVAPPPAVELASSPSPPAASTAVDTGPRVYSIAEARLRVPDSLEYLPVLGVDGYIVRTWTHVLAGWWRSGKSELMAAIALPWLRAGMRVVWVTEEPDSLWVHRADTFDEIYEAIAWDNLKLVDAMSAPPAQLLDTVAGIETDVVICDTIREVCGINSMRDDDEVKAKVNPWVRRLRDGKRTPIFLAQHRKAAGERGERIEGSVALPAMMDAVLELEYVPGQDSRRRLSVRRRGTQTQPLVYEMDDLGRMVVIPDARSRSRQEAEAAAEFVVNESSGPLTTLEVWGRMAPKPSRDTALRALTALAEKALILRDPPITERAERRSVTWKTAAADQLHLPQHFTPHRLEYAAADSVAADSAVSGALTPTSQSAPL
jgi:hypothetical protein